MNYRQASARTYKKFSSCQGNDHIAGDYALEKILHFITQFRSKRILEIGLGIGSIADNILTFAAENRLDLEYSGTESNDFCLNELPKNVTHFQKIQLYASLADVPSGETFDFIIVDGSDDSLSNIAKHCANHAIVFIEGGRMGQIATLKKIFPNCLSSEIISIRKPPHYGPFSQTWTGGGSLIAINPTPAQKLFVLGERVQTFVKRRLRKIIK